LIDIRSEGATCPKKQYVDDNDGGNDDGDGDGDGD